MQAIRKLLPEALSIAASIILNCSCDEGPIHAGVSAGESSGIEATVDAVIENEKLASWGDGYSLAVAGFADGNDYALISKNIIPDSDGVCHTIIKGIPAEVNTVEVCVIDRLRRRVATFSSIECVESGKIIHLEAGHLDIDPLGVIQRDIFNTTCVQCHGGTEHHAANLDLTEGNSITALLKESVKEPGRDRLTPGDPNESLLYRILSTDESASWRYDHSVEVISTVKLNLIKDWIENLRPHDIQIH